jgi:predicted amidohydrolase
MLKKVGFFHFGADHSTPKAALECALEAAGDVHGGLIVLPEAFNIAVPYRGQGERNFERAVLGELRGLAQRFNVAFVAGLVVKENSEPAPPYSAAYFIESTVATLMCYKIGADDMAGINYTACRTQADFNNPILYHGVRIGALICVDANPTVALSRVLLPRLRTVANGSDLVCILSHTGKGNFSDGKVGCGVNLTENCQRLVLANSKPDGIDSFVTDSKGKIIEPTVGGDQTKIVTVPFG